jgi:hypothetical protein
VAVNLIAKGPRFRTAGQLVRDGEPVSTILHPAIREIYREGMGTWLVLMFIRGRQIVEVSTTCKTIS